MSDPIDDEIAQALVSLSPVQRGRVIANLKGETATAIAKRQNVSPQAVAETLARPEVRDVTMRVAGHVIGSREAGGVCKLISQVLDNLQQCAFEATRPIVVGGRLAEVADYRMRFDASLKLLEFISPPQPEPTIEEHISRETTVRTRAVRRNRAP